MLESLMHISIEEFWSGICVRLLCYPSPCTNMLSTNSTSHAVLLRPGLNKWLHPPSFVRPLVCMQWHCMPSAFLFLSLTTNIYRKARWRWRVYDIRIYVIIVICIIYNYIPLLHKELVYSIRACLYNGGPESKVTSKVLFNTSSRKSFWLLR